MKYYKYILSIALLAALLLLATPASADVAQTSTDLPVIQTLEVVPQAPTLHVQSASSTATSTASTTPILCDLNGVCNAATTTIASMASFAATQGAQLPFQVARADCFLRAFSETFAVRLSLLQRGIDPYTACWAITIPNSN